MKASKKGYTYWAVGNKRKTSKIYEDDDTKLWIFSDFSQAIEKADYLRAKNYPVVVWPVVIKDIAEEG